MESDVVVKPREVMPRGASTLPARYYTDERYFRRELESLFASLWICAGRVEQVEKPGQFILREVLGESIIITSNAAGRVNAFYNVCRHRGTKLCTDAHGTFGRSIQCPYHAWTYGLDGRLVAAPQMDEVEGFDKSQFPLRTVACETWDGHIFINLAAQSAATREMSDDLRHDRGATAGREGGPPSLRDQLADLPQRFAPWRMQELRVAHRIEYDIATNWKLVVQNYNECLHCPVIHPLLNRMHHYLGADNVPTTGTYCGGAMGFKAGVETLSSDGKRRRDFLPGLGERERSVVNYFAIYPNFLLTLHPDYMMTITIWPQHAGRTKLIAEWHFHPDEIAKADFVFEDAIEFWDRTNREDWAISEQSYLGISSRGYAPGPYSERERQLWEFDQFVTDKLRP
jgi:Rieske 2Fe-2S family protein